MKVHLQHLRVLLQRSSEGGVNIVPSSPLVYNELMKKVAVNELRDESDVECVAVFIKKFNSLKGTDYQDVVRSSVLNDTDIFCYTPDHSSYLDVQVIKSDSATMRSLGKGKKGGPAVAKGYGNFLTRIPNSIQSAEEKFLKQKKDISNIILLLDEAGSPPEFLLREIKKNVKTSGFREVWTVCKNATVFRLF